MRNRAKCKLCGDVIESFHRYDYVYCKCNEIGITGGNYEYHVSAKDFKNFLRIDEDGNEIMVTIQDAIDISEKALNETTTNSPSRQELIQMLDEMCKKIESLPIEAMYAPISHADFASLMMLLIAIFRSENEN